MTDSLPALAPDPTLDEVRDLLAPLIARHAAFDGWCADAVDNAARDAGVHPSIARLAFSDGPRAMIEAWFGSIDRRMAAEWPPEKITPLKIRERITALVEARLRAIAPDREALRRAMSILAMPQNLKAAAQLGWHAADAIWRAAGDTSVDYNYYTKRTLLGGIYTATMLTFLNDESDDHSDTSAFLARRIGNVMQFERTKARIAARQGNRLSLSRFIGRLRYPAI